MSDRREVMVVVHPGSACGSADFNMGEAQARECRARLVGDLDAWSGAVAVVDGSLSEELGDRRYRGLGAAVDAALARAGAERATVWACDEEGLTERAAGLVAEALGLATERDVVALTGAWYDPVRGHGCVNAVMEGFEALGFDVRVLPGAVSDTDPEWSLATAPSP